MEHICLLAQVHVGNYDDYVFLKIIQELCSFFQRAVYSCCVSALTASTVSVQ